MKRQVYKILIHAGIWLLFMNATVRYLQQWLPENGLHFTASKIWWYSVTYVLTLMLVPYFNYWVLLPVYYFRKKYVVYGAVLLGLCSAMSAAICVIDALFMAPYYPDWLFSAEHLYSRLPYLAFFCLLINFAGVSEELHRKLRREEELKQYRTDAELKWLKAQVSPHFLFNSLNNIYTLVHFKSDDAGPMLVKLANMMRYQLYEGNVQAVPVKREIEYIADYISMQLLKQRWQKKVKMEARSADVPGVYVPSLLFINFVENAFKHGNLDRDGAFIDILFDVQPEKIYFRVSNSFDSRPHKDISSGIGLSNVKHRLSLVYKEAYELNIFNDGRRFDVVLLIHKLNVEK
ncbi:sensor histidine kinase [Chitinophaga barathri]|uniref:Signal transduction histidine kinase internal region domain-containing protein n=1 Tax=Chitinophaga barathri TaxID=1647451 RepID=A0A3N4MG92_9BACT|nr:histidine kinase [Chitinophaga barathri]RPD43052.1 hypothetical protein EG028_01815 [Chitinophaga barathri]